SSHGLANGQQVIITGVVGTTGVIGTWTIRTLTSTTFELIGSTGVGMYTSGGIIGDGGSIPSTDATGFWNRVYYPPTLWSATNTVNQLHAPINVREFGAKGDNSYNDTPAIMAALNAAAGNVAAGLGGAVFFPAGTYIVNELGAQPWSLDVPGDNIT